MHHRPTTSSSQNGATARRRPWHRVLGRLVGRLRDAELDALSSPTVVGDAWVDCVVDPEGGVMLFRVAGTASMRTIDEIDARTQELGARHAVHLDLYDATIPSVRIVRELERVADRLERAMVRVRVVGLDPNHPLLDSRR